MVGPVNGRAVAEEAERQRDGDGRGGGVSYGPNGEGGGGGGEGEAQKRAARPGRVGGGVESERVHVEGKAEGLREGAGNGGVLSTPGGEGRSVVGKGPEGGRRLLGGDSLDGQERLVDDAREDEESDGSAVSRSVGECGGDGEGGGGGGGGESAVEGAGERGEGESLGKRGGRDGEGGEAVERGRDVDVGLRWEECEGEEGVGEFDARRRERLQREGEVSEGERGRGGEGQEHDAVEGEERGLGGEIRREGVVVKEEGRALLRVQHGPPLLVATALQAPGHERHGSRVGDGDGVGVDEEERREGGGVRGLDPARWGDGESGACVGVVGERQRRGDGNIVGGEEKRREDVGVVCF